VLLLSLWNCCSGYVAGQWIHVTIDVNNESRIDVEDIKITLKKIVFYNSQTPTRKTKEEVTNAAEIRCGSVKKRDKGQFDQKILIPAVPPTNLNYCRVLNVSYEVHVTAKISGMHGNPVLKLPVTIGTVPLNIQPSRTMPANFTNTPSTLVYYPTAPVMTPSPTGYAAFPNFNGVESSNATRNLRKSLLSCFGTIHSNCTLFSSTVLPRSHNDCSAVARRKRT